MNNKHPKILILDIETSPILADVWDIWEQNIGLNQIKKDWKIIAWGAKWLNDSSIMYKDTREHSEKQILKPLWELLNEADVLVTQNGKKFDIKKIYARFIQHNFIPPSPFKHVDTCQLAKRHFGFTSNKLEYLADKLNKKYKKLKHLKFPGHTLWTECLSGNLEAWKEMEKYNKHDVLSLEELYSRLLPWSNEGGFSIFSDEVHNECDCGRGQWKRNGVAVTKTGKYQVYKCTSCGSNTRSRQNMLTKEQKKSRLIKIV